MDRSTFKRPILGQAVTTLTILLLASLAGTASLAEPAEDEDRRPDGVTCAGFRQVDGLGPACPAGQGLWEFFSPNGTSLGYTHGPDAAPSPRSDGDSAEPAAAPLQAPICVADPANDHHTVVIYARAYDDSDRYASIAPQLIDEVKRANTHLRIDAGTYDVQADYKMLCKGGTLDVRNEVLPTRRSSASFSTIVTDLRARGYDDNTLKHWVFYDDTNACVCGGMGHVYNDDRPIANNYNNANPNAVPMFGVTFGHVDYTIMMHEHGHNMGAVQLTAPHSTKAWHCTDGRDIMCYNDGGSRGNRYTTSACSRTAFDCGHDDYFHPAVSSGYLATHWNIGSSLNRFVTYGPCGLAREGTATTGGAGIFWDGVTGREETGISSDCWGRQFVLHSTFGSGDFDVCFYKGTQRLSCHATPGDESGIVPDGTTKARVLLYVGVLEQYTLITP